MSEPEIRIVCFDLGGVIGRTCMSYEEACGEAGLAYRSEIDAPPLNARLRACDAAWQTGVRLSPEGAGA